MAKFCGLQLMMFVVLILTLTVPCSADVGLTWSGDLTVEENIQDGQWADDSFLHLKMNLNNGENQRGVVLLKYLTPDPAQPSPNDLGSLAVYQAYIDLIPSPGLLLRLGRQNIAWGSGFFWNPTNYIGSGKDRADFMIDNPGVDAIDAEYIQGKSSLMANLKPGDNWYATGKAIKAATQIGHCDLAVSAFEQDTTKAFGLDFATVVGNNTIYNETAWKAGEDNRFYISGGAEYATRSADQYYLHEVIGVNHTFAENTFLIMEYYYNQAGWNQQEADAFNSYSGSDKPALIGLKTSTFLADLRQNYLFLTFSTANFIMDDFTLSASVVWNIDDQSCLITPILRYDIGQNTYFALNTNIFSGAQTSEFGSFIYKTLINAQVVLSF